MTHLMMIRKKILQFMLVLFWGIGSYCVCAADVDVTVEPNPMKVGDQGNYIVTTHGNLQLRDVQLPQIDGITWHQTITSESFTIRNGITSRSRGFAFSATKEGSFTIPPIQLTYSNGQTEKTKPFTLLVKRKDWGVRNADGTPVKLSDLIQSKIFLRTPKKEFYVGEEIEVILQIFVHPTLDVEMTYPSFPEVPDLVFEKNQDPNSGESFNCFYLGETSVQRGNDLFKSYTFLARFRSLKPGTFAPMPVDATVKLVERVRETNPFFGPSFSRQMRPYSFQVQLPSLNVKEIPPPPRDAIDLRLVGNYQVSFTCSEGPYKLGECITLDMFVRGGNVKGIQAPTLSFDAFRVYPPETTEEGKGRAMRIRYVLLPTQQGTFPVSLNTVFFQPASGSYKTASFNREFTIEPNPLATQASLIQTSGDVSRVTDAPDNNVRLREILYLKPMKTDGILYPLSANNKWLRLALIGCGVLGALLFLILVYMRKHRDSSPETLRYRDALARRKSLITKLQNASNEEFERLCRTEFMDWICDMKRAPSGSSVSELCDHLKNPELIQTLKEIEMSTYRPGGLSSNQNKSKNVLIHTLKKLSFVFVFACAFPLLAATETASDSMMDGTSAYDAGNFQAALAFYQKQAQSLNPKYLHPEIMYNMGNCYFQMQKYPEAMLMFERAHRLNPSDADILSNLNACCRKLDLPERGAVNSPLDFLRQLRDSFRLDTWQMIFAVSLALFILVCGLYIYTRRKELYPIGIALHVLFLFAIGMECWQQSAFFIDDAAYIRSDKTPVWSIYASESAKELATLPKGASVQVREIRSNSVLVRVNDIEGWVDIREVLMVIPHVDDFYSTVLKSHSPTL